MKNTDILRALIRIQELVKDTDTFRNKGVIERELNILIKMV